MLLTPAPARPGPLAWANPMFMRAEDAAYTSKIARQTQAEKPRRTQESEDIQNTQAIDRPWHRDACNAGDPQGETNPRNSGKPEGIGYRDACHTSHIQHAAAAQGRHIQPGDETGGAEQIDGREGEIKQRTDVYQPGQYGQFAMHSAELRILHRLEPGMGRAGIPDCCAEQHKTEI